MRRGHYIALLAVACLVGLAVLAWVNRPRDEPTKATVDDAVRSFRAEAGREGSGGGQGEPPLGVYRYATRGFETVQNATAGGATHDYRGISTVALSTGSCGERERWQVLAGRWSEGESCPPSHGEVRSTVREFHEFFGVGQENSFECRGASVSAAQLRPGARFSSSCASEGSSISSAVRIVGIEPVSVGGEKFDAIHSTSRSLLSGETTGKASRDEWRRRSDGLLLRRSADSDAETSGEGGDTHYSEHYTLQLLAVTPQR
jgi:hypothetical protein